MTDSGDHDQVYCIECGRMLRRSGDRSVNYDNPEYLIEVREGQEDAFDDAMHELGQKNIIYSKMPLEKRLQEEGGGETTNNVESDRNTRKECSRIERIIDREITGFENRIQLELENKEETDEDSFSHKRSIIRVNCYNLARRKLEQIKTEVMHDV